MKRFMLIAALAVPLFGCLGVADYKAPIMGDMARIEFVNDASSEARVDLYGDAAQCRNKSRLKPAIAPGARVDARVAVDRDLAFTVLKGNIYQYCMSTRSFRPEAGKVYEIHFRDADNGCSVFGMQEGRPIALVRREWVRPFDESGSFCTPLD